MIRRALLLLAALCLHGAALAQSTINVKVIYTPGAAAAAAAAGTTVQAKVNALVGDANTAYSASGIGITLVPWVDSSAESRAPADSAPMSRRFDWVKNDPVPWTQRTQVDGSITILITDAQGQTGATIAASQPASVYDSVAVVPYNQLNLALESAISKIIGATNGYQVRARTYPTDAVDAGANVCYHTREAPPSNTATVVPYLPAFRIYPPGFGASGMVSSDSGTQGPACNAYLQYMRTTNGNSPAYSSYSLSSVTSTGAQCNLLDNFGAASGGGQIVLNTNPGGSTISCGDARLAYYSKNGTTPTQPYRRLGDASSDSVGAMNARANTVSAWSGRNATILDGLKNGFISWLMHIGRN